MWTIQTKLVNNEGSGPRDQISKEETGQSKNKDKTNDIVFCLSLWVCLGKYVFHGFEQF
jgi:hypothetical protein